MNPPAQPEPQSPPQPANKFQAALRTFLTGVIERCTQGTSWVDHVSFIPSVSLKNKLPFYKEAQAHPEVSTRLSVQQSEAVRLHAACRAHPPDISRVRQRPHRARDAFGPGMVFVVNAVLTWLMFSIDVGNSMLK